MSTFENFSLHWGGKLIKEIFVFLSATCTNLPNVSIFHCPVCSSPNSHLLDTTSQTLTNCYWSNSLSTLALIDSEMLALGKYFFLSSFISGHWLFFQSQWSAFPVAPSLYPVRQTVSALNSGEQIFHYLDATIRKLSSMEICQKCKGKKKVFYKEENNKAIEKLD